MSSYKQNRTALVLQVNSVVQSVRERKKECAEAVLELMLFLDAVAESGTTKEAEEAAPQGGSRRLVSSPPPPERASPLALVRWVLRTIFAPFATLFSFLKQGAHSFALCCVCLVIAYVVGKFLYGLYK